MNAALRLISVPGASMLPKRFREPLRELAAVVHSWTHPLEGEPGGPTLKLKTPSLLRMQLILRVEFDDPTIRVRELPGIHDTLLVQAAGATADPKAVRERFAELLLLDEAELKRLCTAITAGVLQ